MKNILIVAIVFLFLVCSSLIGCFTPAELGASLAVIVIICTGVAYGLFGRHA